MTDNNGDTWQEDSLTTARRLRHPSRHPKLELSVTTDDDEAMVIVAARVLDARRPYVPSVLLDCRDCRLPCYVSETTIAVSIEENVPVEVLCMTCFADLVEHEPELIKSIDLHPRMLAEAEEYIRRHP